MQHAFEANAVSSVIGNNRNPHVNSNSLSFFIEESCEIYPVFTLFQCVDLPTGKNTQKGFL